MYAAETVIVTRSQKAEMKKIEAFEMSV